MLETNIYIYMYNIPSLYKSSPKTMFFSLLRILINTHFKNLTYITMQISIHLIPLPQSPNSFPIVPLWATENKNGPITEPPPP